MTFDATLNPVVYEGGIPIFIDTERNSWNMDPVALEKAFEMYPEVKLVVSAELPKNAKKKLSKAYLYHSSQKRKPW